MKKLLCFAICGMMALGISGCSSNEVLSNEDFYRMLKDEGYEFEISKYTESFNIDGKYSIRYSTSENYENVDSVILDTDDINMLIFYYPEISDDPDNPEVVAGVSAQNGCYVFLDESLEADTTECSSTDLIDTENARDEATEILLELKTNPDALMEFCQWYYDENADTIETEDYSY